MSLHLHELGGCAPAPLAHYLKALGILRLVSEQADANARGFWRGERFCLVTEVSREEMEAFFLERYAPTPMFAPWNAGCGFYRTWDEKRKILRNSKNGDALNKLRSQKHIRFAGFILAADKTEKFLAAHATLKDVLALSKKERDKHLILPSIAPTNMLHMFDKDKDKSTLQKLALTSSSGYPFVRSVIAATGDSAFKYPGLWGGTGGNAGNMEFSARYFENLVTTLVDCNPDKAKSWLENSLFNESKFNLVTGAEGKVGQFLPGGAGGANSVAGFGDQMDTLLNPWDFVLMIEGAVVLSSATTSRLRCNQTAMASPFVVDSNSAGYASAVDTEANKGEQWLPLWKNPLSKIELGHFLSEGRAALGRKTATDTLGFARSVAKLGTSRGVESFQRFSYITRNGDLNFAIPLGRFVVPEHKLERISNLDDIELYLIRLQRLARDKDASTRIKIAVHTLTNTALEVAQQPANTTLWQSLLIAAANLEAIQSNGSGFSAGPIPKLRAEWVEAANDGSAEFRLALAFAGQAAQFSKNKALNPIRQHFQTLNNGRFATSGGLTSQRLQPEPQVVVNQRVPVEDCIAIVNRRMIDRSTLGVAGFPLLARRGFSASAADIAELLSGDLDLARTLLLARAFCALDFSKSTPLQRAPTAAQFPDDAWMVIRLSLLPWPLVEGKQIPPDPAIARRLSAGDAAGAFALARQRLAAHGIHATVRRTSQPPDIARLWAAALAFPISQNSAVKFLKRIDPNFSSTHQI
jgi:CRISPR-associated protein Csx17